VEQPELLYTAVGIQTDAGIWKTVERYVEERP